MWKGYARRALLGATLLLALPGPVRAQSGEFLLGVGRVSQGTDSWSSPTVGLGMSSPGWGVASLRGEVTATWSRTVDLELPLTIDIVLPSRSWVSLRGLVGVAPTVAFCREGERIGPVGDGFAVGQPAPAEAPCESGSARADLRRVYAGGLGPVEIAAFQVKPELRLVRGSHEGHTGQQIDHSRWSFIVTLSR